MPIRRGTHALAIPPISLAAGYIAQANNRQCPRSTAFRRRDYNVTMYPMIGVVDDSGEIGATVFRRTALFITAVLVLALYATVLLYQPTRPGLIEYACERNHRAADFIPERVRSVDLRLTRMVVPGVRASEWEVKTPAGVAGKAVTFRLETGSFGGSEGFQWKGADGRTRTAFVSFSDIVGKFGPYSAWVDLAEGGSRTYKGPGKSDYEKYTCGPVALTRGG
jgi:hypothetical protein